MNKFLRIFLGLALSLSLGSQVKADTTTDIEALSKQVQNPLSTLVAIPFQNNTNFKTGPRKRTTNDMQMQPFFPVRLNADYNMLVRSVIPITYVPPLVPGMKRQFGLQDSQLQLFFTGNRAYNLFGGQFSVGAGPNFYLPTATKYLLGQHRWGLGPSVVVVLNKGPWVTGTLITSTFSILKRTSKRGIKQHISNSSVQPFINYNLKGGWAIATNPTISLNWRLKSGDNFTLPLGGGVSRTFLMGKQPVMANVSAYYNVVRPHESSRWFMRAVFVLLFPQGKQASAPPQQ